MNCSIHARISVHKYGKEIASRERLTDFTLAYTRSPTRSCACAYNHYFVLDENSGDELRVAALVHDRQSGRSLEVLTTQPGVQFYTGNNLNGSVAGHGGAYRQSAGLAIEPQGFPDAPNRPEFPSTVLRPGAVYRHVIAYRLTTE